MKHNRLLLKTHGLTMGWSGVVMDPDAICFSCLDPASTQVAGVAMAMVLLTQKGGHLTWIPIGHPPFIPEFPAN